MRSSFSHLALAATFVWSTASPARAQLTLRDALAEAGRAGFNNRVAAGNTAAQRAQARVPLEGILPNIHVDAGYARTTTATGRFGTTLRQRSVDSHQAALVIEQPLVNVDAWAGRRGAIHAATSADAIERWIRVSTAVEVVRAYYGIVLADERVAALRAAAQAAHAHVAEAEALLKQGVVTKSDVLLATVRAGDVDAQLADATAIASTTRRQLTVLLGREGLDPLHALIAATHLPSAERIRAEVATDTSAHVADARNDVRAALAALEAARGDAIRAKSALLPHVNGFARYERSTGMAPYPGDRFWTVGIVASWKPLADVSDLADVEATKARVHAAAAHARGAQANALLEIEQTRTALSTALTRLEIAERSAAQSVEAHRIVSRRYSGGLASVVELLEAQAGETQSVLALSHARYSAIVAAAERRRAIGLDPASIASLEDASPTITTARR